MLSLRPHSYINTASVLQSTMKAKITQSLKPHVSHKYISVHPSLTTMWYYNDTICTVLPDRLFSQLNHTATHFCLHFPVVTIMSQIADWATITLSTKMIHENVFNFGVNELSNLHVWCKIFVDNKEVFHFEWETMRILKILLSIFQNVITISVNGRWMLKT